MLLILKTLFACLSVGLGFYLAYIYIRGIDQGSSPLLLIPVAILILGGTTLLMYLSRAIAHTKEKNTHTTEVHDESKGLATLLKKNNDLTHQWKRITVLREKLRMMQLSAEEKATKQLS